MLELDIQPYLGALPLAFGMRQRDVHMVLGEPESVRAAWKGAGTFEYWLAACVNVGFDPSGAVNHIGFGPGAYVLRPLGQALWSPGRDYDPNPSLLRLDHAPVELLGFLVFVSIGITTTGYHDDDPAQRALTVFPRGAWDDHLSKAAAPDLRRYSGYGAIP